MSDRKITVRSGNEEFTLDVTEEVFWYTKVVTIGSDKV